MILATLQQRDALVVTTDHGPYVIHESHPNYAAIVQIFLDAGDEYPEWDEVEPLLDIASGLRRRVDGTGVEVTTNQVLYNGEPLSGPVVDHLLRLVAEGHDLGPCKLFITSLMANPSFRSREQLYGFMEASNITINQHGQLLLYKKVRADYYDVHTGRTYLNTVGSVIEMPRTQVDDDPTRTCSAGLHVAAHSYIPQFGGERVVIVAVAPEDVVSIPTDYNNAKMRVCKYTVVAEQKAAMHRPTLNQAYMSNDTLDDYESDEDYQTY